MDTTDDIAEEISFQGFEDDCGLLRSLLDDVLMHEVGADFMVKLERVRRLAQVPFPPSIPQNQNHARFGRL